jgi:hypothetical protein
VQSDPDEALDVLYRLQENWTKRAEAGAQVILRAIESLMRRVRGGARRP